MATKRGNGEGSAPYKRKDGRWCARYTVYTTTGPKRKPVYGRTRAEAAEKLAKALADREGTRFTLDAKNLTVGRYLARWLEDNVQGSVKPSPTSPTSGSYGYTSHLRWDISSSRRSRRRTCGRCTARSSKPDSRPGPSSTSTRSSTVP